MCKVQNNFQICKGLSINYVIRLGGGGAEILSMQPYINPTIRTMEEDLNFLKMEDDLNFFLMEDTSILFNGRQLIFFLKMEDDLIKK
jgi:hypothetical protein